MKSLKELREVRDELLSKADVIQARIEAAEKEGKEADAADLADWQDLMAEGTGLVAKNQAEIDRATEIEQQRKALALAKTRSAEVTNFGGAKIETSGAGSDIRDNVRHVLGKPKCFAGDNAIRDAYDSGLWIKALVARSKGQPDEATEQKIMSRRGWDVRAAATESSATAGGYLVPATLSNTILDVRAQVGISRMLTHVMPMSGDTLDVPRRTGGLTVYAPGEGNAITASDKTWGKVSLVAKKRAVAAQLSQELQDDAIIGVVDDAMQEMAYALADEEDSELINGDGTSTYFGVTGLLTRLATGTAAVATAATGHDTWPELDTTDVANWMGLLPSKHRVRGRLAIICSANFYHTALFRIMIAGGGNTISNLQAGIADAQFLGYPVYFTDKMPVATAASTNSALFGNFYNAAIIGDRSEVRMALSNDYAFLSDLTTVKATVRYDINVYDYGSSSAAGAYVSLKTAS